MTPLRQRFIEDMQIRNLSPKTIKTYTSHVVTFAAFHGKSPEHLGPEEIRRWQVDLVQRRKVSWSTFKHRMILTTLYATGLRIMEALVLTTDDVDSARMLVRVRMCCRRA
jgi:site-specific recombinase XerD